MFMGDDIRDRGLVVCLRDVVNVLTFLEFTGQECSDQDNDYYVFVSHTICVVDLSVTDPNYRDLH